MSCRVLFLESDPRLRKEITSFLFESGIDVDPARDLAEARRKLADERYDLLLIDAAPVDGDGLDFAHSLRAAEIGTPFIIAAQTDCPTSRHRAEMSDASAFLPKPYGGAQLRSLIQRAVSHGRQEPASGRVMMYSHDTIGLGHMRRNANIATRVLERSSDASVLMMVGSPAGFVFDMPHGMDFIKLPSLVKEGRGKWRPGSLRTGEERLRSLRAGLLRETAETFEPDVILVDHVPTGVWGELTDTLRFLRSASWRPHVMLGLRDILDTPEHTLRNWREDGAIDAINGLYDEILIYGDREVFDTAAAYELESIAPGRVRFCGYVAVERPAGAWAAANAATPDDTRPKIMISGGGGRDAYPMMSASLEALRTIPAAERPDATFVAGPLMDAGLRAILRIEVENLSLKYADMLTDYPARLAEADLLVCMGGYNSMVEAMNLGLPTAVAPRMGPSAEQLTRARLFADRGLVELLMPEQLNPRSLSRMFRNVRRRSGSHRPLIEANGSVVAADRILEALRQNVAEPLPRIA